MQLSVFVEWLRSILWEQVPGGEDKTRDLHEQIYTFHVLRTEMERNGNSSLCCVVENADTEC